MQPSNKGCHNSTMSHRDSLKQGSFYWQAKHNRAMALFSGRILPIPESWIVIQAMLVSSKCLTCNGRAKAHNKNLMPLMRGISGMDILTWGGPAFFQGLIPTIFFNHRSSRTRIRFPWVSGGFLERFGSRERMELEGTPRVVFSLFGWFWVTPN